MKKLHPLVIGAIIVQILDGILTYIGVTRFGELAEGNPLVKYLIVNLGVVFGLLLPKSIAILSVLGLNSQVEKSTAIKGGLTATIIFYVLVAILPWVVILSIF